MFMKWTIQKRLKALGLSYLVEGPNGLPVEEPEPEGFQDDYNRADAALESSTTSSSGGTWVHDGLIANALSISSNQIRSNTTNSAGSAYSAGDQGTADHFVEFTSGAVSSFTGTFHTCRLTDNSNFIGIRAGRGGTGEGQVEVYVRVAGALSSRYTSPVSTYTAGDVLRLETSGTNFSVYKNDVLLTGPTAISAAGLTSQQTGIVARTVSAVVGDNFNTGAL